MRLYSVGARVPRRLNVRVFVCILSVCACAVCVTVCMFERALVRMGCFLELKPTSQVYMIM